jgi:hypothetical protein
MLYEKNQLRGSTIMECHRCKEYGIHAGKDWKDTPCSRCELKEDSYGTMPYREDCTANSFRDENPDDEVWSRERADDQCPQPYDNLDLEDEDPKIPMSKMVSAMSLWLHTSLPARKSIRLRMDCLPYAEIGKRLGCSRQAVEKLIAKAIAREPLLQNLLPAKAPRDPAPLSAPHKSAIGERNRRSRCRMKKSK